MLATLVQVTGKALIVGILRSSNLGIEVVRVVAWQLTKRAASTESLRKLSPTALARHSWRLYKPDLKSAERRFRHTLAIVGRWDLPAVNQKAESSCRE